MYVHRKYLYFANLLILILLNLSIQKKIVEMLIYGMVPQQRNLEMIT